MGTSKQSLWTHRAAALLWTTLVKFELTAKSASGQVKRLRRALDAPVGGASSRIAPEVS